MGEPKYESMPHVVIVGGGFGGLEIAIRLKKSRVRVSLIDRRNYHLFQPLLYQVATGGLSPANIATPLRSILRKHRNCEVLMGEVNQFEFGPGSRPAVLLDDRKIEFDFLIVATGSTHSYFGNDQWQALAPGLKTIPDATYIRRKIYLAFEAAERETDAELRRELMTFVVVGGGPTGVELAGALAEIARHTLRKDFRHINPQDARILIVEAAPHVLSHYPAELCQCAEKKIKALGIEVHTNTKVMEIAADHVRLEVTSAEPNHNGEADQNHGEAKTSLIVPTQTVLWAAGVRANPLGATLASACGVEPDRGGRVPVDDQLNIAGHNNVFVIGDLAKCLDQDGNPLPGLAPVAMQQGKYVAKKITALAKNSTGDSSDSIQQTAGKAQPFHYRDRGTMATIGRAAAVAQIGKRQFCGLFAWLLWLLVHLMLIVQFQNRLLILIQWGWNYITFNRSARIIVEDDGQARSKSTTPSS